MEKKLFRWDNKALIAVIVLALVLITVLTKYSGTTDTGDYSDVAKYFSGGYDAKIRSSHSYLMGLVHSPFVALTDSFISFKISSLIFLLLLVYSVYRITNKNMKALWMMLLSPIVWYMAPWINPIQISSLLFLWAYYFIDKYDKNEELKHLAYSGILVGLSWCFWDTIWLFGGALALIFMFNKKFSNLILIGVFVLVGLLPRLALDTYLFGFPFYSILKNIFGTLTNTLGGVAGLSSGHSAIGFMSVLVLVIVIPYLFWRNYHPGRFMKEKKTMILLTFILLFIFLNPQIRYLLVPIPIIIVLIARTATEIEIRRLIAVSAVISLLVALPYAVQIAGSLEKTGDGADFATFFVSPSSIELSSGWTKDKMLGDLRQLAASHPKEVFVVGNAADDYQVMADLYWEDNVNEFVSIQDYNLYLKNSSTLFEKKFMPTPRIDERRQIWIAGGMSKNVNDDTDYEGIDYAIGVNEPIEIEGFEVVNKYGSLYLSKKTD